MGRVTHSRRTQNPKTGSDICVKVSNDILNQIKEKENIQPVQATINNLEELAEYRDAIASSQRIIEHIPNEEEESAMNDVFDVISEFVALCKRVSSEYNKNSTTAQSQDLLISDIMHEIELGPPKDLGRAYKVYAKLRSARNKRRIAKNRNKVLSPLYEYIKQNSNFIEDLCKIKSKCAMNLYDVSHSTYAFKSNEELF